MYEQTEGKIDETFSRFYQFLLILLKYRNLEKEELKKTESKHEGDIPRPSS